jgi:hypothetical protein
VQNTLFAGETDFLELARRGHRQTRDSITSIHAKMRTVTTASILGKTKPVESTISYWQSGTSYRWQAASIDPEGRSRISTGGSPPDVVQVETLTDSAVADGRFTSLVRKNQSDGQKGISGTLGAANPRDTSGVTVWSRAGFLVEDNPPRTLLELLEDNNAVEECRFITESDCVYVRLNGPSDLGVEAWLCARHGFLIKRMLVYRHKLRPKGTYVEYENLSFKEFPGPIFFPTHSIMTGHFAEDKKGQPGVVVDTQFEALSINERIPPETFRLEIPEGVPTHDRSRNVFFTMGRDGKPMPNQPIVPVDAQPGPVGIARPSHRPPTLRWIVAGGSFLLVALGSWFLWRRRARRVIVRRD